MSARKTTHQLWNMSRGIVFAGGGSVVYPQLPLARHYSAPTPVASAESQACPPEVLPTPEELSVSKRAEDAQCGVATAQGTPCAAVTTVVTTSTISTTSTAIVVGEKAAVIDTAEEPRPKDTGPQSAPFTPLDFKIPDETFRKARNAAAETPESFWGYHMYRGPGDDGTPDAKVKVHYCTSSTTTERVVKEYFLKEKILGFDLEWAANATKALGPRKNVSLVQLASPSRIGLFQIAAYPEKDKLVAPSLKQLLEDPEITKIGVAIKGDCTRMSNYLDINVRGQFELSHLYRLVKYSKSGEHNLVNKRLISLAAQTQEFLGLPLFKGSDVRESDWTKRLNTNQIMCKPPGATV